MCKPIRILVIVLLCLVGSTPYAFASHGHGGFHGGGFGHGGFHGGGFGHHHFIAPHRFGHFHQPHFHGGLFFDVSPLWIAPQPYVEVTPVPAPPWYYCPNPPGYYPAVPACTVPWVPVYPPG
jgi:hypothetical protein